MDTATLPETAATRPASYRHHTRLADHTPLLLRSIRADDKNRLHAHFRTLSTDSVIQRFFEAKGHLTVADLAFYTELDFERHFALVAVLEEEEGEERIVGVGRAIESPGDAGGRNAEVAFAVADPYQGRGIGSLLLRHLAILGRHLGYDRFEAWVLPGNGRMLDVFLHSGFAVRRTLEDGTIHVRFPITGEAKRG
jgi:GNAT superfamily N-acetyltransferase